MKKRLKKKLYTDKTFGSDRKTMLKSMKSMKIKKSLIREGKITVGRINLGIPYKNMKI